MPTDSRAGSVFCYEKVLEVLLCKTGQISGLLADGEKKGWNWGSLTQLRVIEIVPPAERDHPPLAREAVKFEFPKGQLLDFANKRVLLHLIQNVRMILKSFRQRGLVVEQVELARHSGGKLHFSEVNEQT